MSSYFGLYLSGDFYDSQPSLIHGMYRTPMEVNFVLFKNWPPQPLIDKWKPSDSNCLSFLTLSWGEGETEGR